MFEIDEHLMSQILAIGLIVLLIVVFFGYIITAIFSKIMFDILGVRPGLAFIPFYNTYRIYKEFIKNIKGVFGRAIGELPI